MKMPQPQTGAVVPPSLTQLAAQHLEKIRNGKLSSEVRDKTILCLLDYFGALGSGLSAPWAKSLLRYAQVSTSGSSGLSTSSSSSSPQSGGVSVMGLQMLCSAETAAFTNASIAHGIIRDDMHLAAGAHIGVMVIPAALALAQRDSWSGEQLLKAVVGGYEMAVALGSAVRSSGTCNPHFRPSGIIGAFASAATGIMADPTITQSQSACALGLAANMAAGLNEWPWAGGLEITTQMGTAARAGITSYDLAKAGVSSSLTILEGKDGLFEAYGCGDRKVAATVFRNHLLTVDDEDAASRTDETTKYGAGVMGAKFKPVAGCNFIQTPVCVALRIHDSLNSLDKNTNCATTTTSGIENIDRITITTTSPAITYPGCDNTGPFRKVQQTKMSLQYAVSSALLFGRVDEWTYRHFSNKQLDYLIGKCVLETDAGFDEDLYKRGKQPCKIEVKMKNGHVHRDFMGDVPWLDGEAVEERFKREANTMFVDRADVTKGDPARGVVDEIILECRRLGTSQSTERLFELLASGGPLIVKDNVQDSVFE